MEELPWGIFFSNGIFLTYKCGMDYSPILFYISSCAKSINFADIKHIILRLKNICPTSNNGNILQF